MVEASDEGKGLYARFGFQALRHVRLREASGRFNGREEQEFWWMVRPVSPVGSGVGGDVGGGLVSRALVEAAREDRGGAVGDSGRMGL